MAVLFFQHSFIIHTMLITLAICVSPTDKNVYLFGAYTNINFMIGAVFKTPA